jgi:hypothetical protein
MNQRIPLKAQYAMRLVSEWEPAAVAEVVVVIFLLQEMATAK